MRMQDVEMMMDELPAQEYDFSEAGVEALTSTCKEPHQLDAMATMLNNDPKKLVGTVFKDSSVRSVLLSLPTADILNAIRRAVGTVAPLAASIARALIAARSFALDPKAAAPKG